MTSPTPKPGILDISPYVGGRAGVPGVAKVHKLSSNESPLGPSPAVLAALDAAKAAVALYPEGSAADAARGHRRSCMGWMRRASSVRATAPTCC